MYWKADDADADDEERERKWKVLLLYVCLHSNRLVQENFPSSSLSASSFHREEISCFMIRRIGLEFW